MAPTGVLDPPPSCPAVSEDEGAVSEDEGAVSEIVLEVLDELVSAIADELCNSEVTSVGPGLLTGNGVNVGLASSNLPTTKSQVEDKAYMEI